MLRLLLAAGAALLLAQAPPQESLADRVGGGPAGADAWSIAACDWGPGTLVYSDFTGGVFRSTNGGRTWTPADEGLSDDTVELACDPLNPGVVIASVHRDRDEADVLFQSADQGRAWTEAGRGKLPGGALAIDSYNPVIEYRVQEEALFKTTDGGKNWQRLSRGLGNARISAVAIDPWNSDVVLAGSNDHEMFKSTTAGATWVRMATDVGHNITGITFAPSNPQIVYAHGDIALLKSSDAGEHWTAIGEELPIVHGFVIDPVSADTVYAATTGGVHKTVDGGRRWASINAGVGRSSAMVSSVAWDPPVFLVQANEGNYTSVDRGHTWSKAFVADPPARIVHSRFVDGAIVIRTVAGEFINNGRPDAWKPYVSPQEPAADLSRVPNSLASRSERRNQTLYASGWWTGVYRSRDEGRTWSLWFDKELHSMSYKLFFDEHQAKTVFVLADQLYVGAAYGDLYRTTDDGDSWTRLEVDTSRNVPLDYVTTLPTTPVTVFAVTDDSERPGRHLLWRSADGGDTWLRAAGLPSRVEVTSIVAMPGDLHVLFAGTRGRGVFRSEDGGATWQPTAVK